MAGSFVKDPNAVLDYELDWSAWLASGETIQTSTWIVPAGITRMSDTSATTSTTIWLAGGTAGQTYSVVNRVATNQARTEDQTIRIYVRER